jgi:endoglucanase
LHHHVLNISDFHVAFDIHEYLDSDFSGSHSTCASLASTYLAPLTSWLQEYGFKAMITEFGAANGTQCDSYVVDIINYMADNDVYIGWSAWAAGPLWGSYSACCANSEQWGSLEPDSLASDGSPGMYETVWLAEIEPLLPTTLQSSGISNLNGPGGVVGSGSSSKVSTSTSTATTTTFSKTSTTSSSQATTSTASSCSNGVAMWGQCGGETYSGSTTCICGATCVYSNPWYSQCLAS